MSVNCTACPPPLVLKTLPCGWLRKNERTQEETSVQNTVQRVSETGSVINQKENYSVQREIHARYEIIWSLESDCDFTLISLVSISPSEASSWCLSTYFWHLDRAFSLGVDTLIALGMIGCMTVSRSKLEAGLWSTHFSPPAECERLCIGWTGRAVWWSQCDKDKPESYSQLTPAVTS